MTLKYLIHQFTYPRRRAIAGLCAVGLLLAIDATGQTTVLSTGHTDLALDYDDAGDTWDLHVGSDTTGLEYNASNVILQAKSLALTTVPSGTNFSFLGAAGTPIWILPQTQNEELLYLGYGGDGIPLGVFVSDQVTVKLLSLSGPGDFFSYKVDGFGNPTVYFNTRNGITTNDQITVQAGGDAHLNWAFTKAGTYRMVLQASGVLVNGHVTTTSPPVTYTFQVVTPAILATGHTDLALDYSDTDGTWDFHVGSDTFGLEFAANEVFLEAKAAALTTIPTNANFSFLGHAGDPITILPQTQDEELLYLGYGGDGIPDGVFVGNQVKVTLKGVTGPGDFFSYKVDGFGTPTVYFNTRDGINSNDFVTVQSGGDAHLNWAFTVPGIYVVTLEASGTLVAGNTPTSSGPVTFFFEVLPPTILSTGHTDLALDYLDTDDTWNFHVGSDSTGLEYRANEVILQVNSEAKTNVPSGSSFSFLGTAGAPIWILPQVQDEELLYLGYGGDGIPEGVFTNNQVKVTLKSVIGPGDFFSYKVDGFGNPAVYFNTRDGITSSDSVTVQSGGDAHLNWAFTAAGTYKVVLQASGTLTNGNPTASPLVTFTFSVIPPTVLLTNEHVDLRVEYNPAGSNVLTIVASDEDHHVKYPSNEVHLVVNANGELTLPAGTPFGNEGDPIWIIPQSQDPTLLYLGISAEGVPISTFSGNLDFRLKKFDGPGNFFLWQANGGGGLTVYMNTTDGISDSDETQPIIPSHSHYNWGFTTNGTYHLTLQTSGLRIGDTTNVYSPLTTFTFDVLPLPVAPTPTPFQLWQAIHWPTSTSDFIKGPGADPDGDGRPNILEYAFGLNPNEPDTSQLPAFSFTPVSGTNYGSLSYTHVKSATDISYAVVATSNLGTPIWTQLTNVVSVIDQGDTEVITVRDALPTNLAPTRFYQLRILSLY
jgi:surface-anchored protein